MANAFHAQQQQHGKRDRQHRQRGGEFAVTQALDGEREDYRLPHGTFAAANGGSARLIPANEISRSNSGAREAS